MRIYFIYFFGFNSTQPITSGTHTDEGAVIRKPGSAWLEDTPAKMILFVSDFFFNLRVFIKE